jgi:hypothetical protein
MTNEEITLTIKNHVRDRKKTHTEMYNLCGISGKTWFERLKKNNWKKTEILVLKYLQIIK